MKTPKKRSSVLFGHTFRKKTGCGKLYVTINKGEDGLVHEVFIKLGKTGSCFCANAEALARMVTEVFRLDGDPQRIVNHLKGIECPSKIEESKSCPDAIGKVIEEFLKIDNGGGK